MRLGWYEECAASHKVTCKTVKCVLIVSNVAFFKKSFLRKSVAQVCLLQTHMFAILTFYSFIKNREISGLNASHVPILEN